MKKIKRILIGILCLMPALFMFACGEIKPSKISFAETELSLVVGDSVSLLPIVEPSGAVGDEITYQISDKNKAYVVIENSTLTATGEGDVIITAKTSNGLTAAIRVKIVKAKTKLSSPTQLSYNDSKNKLSWTSVLNTNSYQLEITKGGSVEYVTVNENSYTFENLTFSTEYKIRVKALTNTVNNAIYLDSDYSTEYKFVKLASPENFAYNIETGKISFSQISYQNFDIEYDLKINNEQIALTSTEHIFKPTIVGEYVVTLGAKVLGENVNVFSSKLQTIKITKLKTPSIVNDGEHITAISSEVAVLKLYINDVEQTGLSVANTYFASAGTYKLTSKATRTSSGTNYFIPSETTMFSVTKLATPQNINLQKGLNKKISLTWDAVSGAGSYDIYQNGIYLTSQSSRQYNFDETVGANTYSVKATLQNGTNSLNISSDMSETKTVFKESAVTLNYNKGNGRMYFTLPGTLTNGATVKFVGSIGSETKITQILQSNTTKTYIEIGNDFNLSENTYNLTAQVLAKTDDNILYIDSNVSSYEISRLEQAEVSFSNKSSNKITASWNAIENAQSYDVYVDEEKISAELTNVNGVISVVLQNVQNAVSSIKVISKTTDNKYLDSTSSSFVYKKLSAPVLEFNNLIKTADMIGIAWNKVELQSEQETASITYDIYVNGTKKDNSTITKNGKIYNFIVGGLTIAGEDYDIQVVATSTLDNVLESESNILTVTKSTAVTSIAHTITTAESVSTSKIEMNDLTNTTYSLTLSYGGEDVETYTDYEVISGKVVFTLGDTSVVFYQTGTYSIVIKTEQNGKLDTNSQVFNIVRLADVDVNNLTLSEDGKTISWTEIPTASTYQVVANQEIYYENHNSFDFSTITEIGICTIKVKAQTSADNMILGSINYAEKDFYVTGNLAKPECTYSKDENTLRIEVADRKGEKIDLYINGTKTEYLIIEEVFAGEVFSYKYLTINLPAFTEAGNYVIYAVAKIGEDSEYIIESSTEISGLELYSEDAGVKKYSLINNSQSDNFTITKLETVDGLTLNYNYDRLEWNSVTGATNYLVKVNFPGIVKNYYSNYNYISLSAITDLTVGGSYSYSVVALSSSNQVLNSDESSSYTFTRKDSLATPTIQSFEYNSLTSKYVLTFSEVANATSYKIYINSGYEISDTNTFNFSISAFNVGENKISVQALITSSLINISEISEEITINKKPIITGLNIVESTLTLNSTQEAYTELGATMTQINSSIDLSQFSSVKINIRDKGIELLTGNTFEMSSEWNVFEINRIVAPQIVFDEENNVVWNDVNGATAYDVYVNDALYSVGLTEGLFTPDFTEVGSYSIKVKTLTELGNGVNKKYNINSVFSNALNIVKLNQIANLTFEINASEELVVSFDKVQNSDYYELTINDIIMDNTYSSDDVVSVNLGTMNFGQLYEIKVKAVKESTATTIGSESEIAEISAYKISTPVVSYSNTSEANYIRVDNYQSYVTNNFALFIEYKEEAKIALTQTYEIPNTWTDLSKVKVFAEYTEVSDTYINSNVVTLDILRLDTVTDYAFREENQETYLDWTAVSEVKKYVVSLTYQEFGNPVTAIVTTTSNNFYKLPSSTKVGNLTFSVVAVANSGANFNSISSSVNAIKLEVPTLTKTSNVNGNFINVSTTYPQNVVTYIKVGDNTPIAVGNNYEIADDVDLSKTVVYAEYSVAQGQTYIIKSDVIKLSDKYSRLASVSGVGAEDNAEEIIVSWNSVLNANTYQIEIYEKLGGDFVYSKTLTTSSNSINIANEITDGDIKLKFRAFVTSTNQTMFNSLEKEVLVRKLEVPTLSYNSTDDANIVTNNTSYAENVVVYAEYQGEKRAFESNKLNIPDEWTDLSKIVVYAVYEGSSTSYIEISSDRIVGLTFERLTSPTNVTLLVNGDGNLEVSWNAVSNVTFYRVKVYSGNYLVLESSKLTERNYIALSSNIIRTGNMQVRVYAYASNSSYYNSLYSSKDFTKLAKPEFTYLSLYNGVYGNYINITNYDTYNSQTNIYLVYDNGIDTPETIIASKVQEISDPWENIDKVTIYAHSEETEFIVLDSNSATLSKERVATPTNFDVSSILGKTTLTWDLVPNATAYQVEIYKDGNLVEDGNQICATNKCELGNSVDSGELVVKLRALGGNSRYNSYETEINIEKIITPTLAFSSDDNKNYLSVNNYEAFVSTYAGNATIYFRYAEETPIVLTSSAFEILDKYLDLSLAKVYAEFTGVSETVYISSENVIVSDWIERLNTPSNYGILENETSVKLTWNSVEGAVKYILTITSNDGDEVVDNITTPYVDITGKIVGNCTFKLKAVSQNGSDFNSLQVSTPIHKLESPTFTYSSDDEKNYITLTKEYSSGVTTYLMYEGENHAINYNQAFEVPDTWEDFSKLKVFATCENQLQNDLIISSDKESITIERLVTSANLQITGDGLTTLTWDSNASASGYIVYVYKNDILVYTSEKLTTNSLVLTTADIPHGNLKVNIRVIGTSGEKYNSLLAETQIKKFETPSVQYISEDTQNTIKIASSTLVKYSSETQGIYVKYNDNEEARININKYVVGSDVIFAIPDTWTDLSLVEVYAKVYAGSDVIVQSTHHIVSTTRIENITDLTFTYNTPTRKTTLSWNTVDSLYRDFIVNVYQNEEIVYTQNTAGETTFELDSNIPSGDLTFGVRALATSPKFNSYETKILAYKLETPTLEYSSNEVGNYFTVTNQTYYTGKGAQLYSMYNNMGVTPLSSATKEVIDNYSTLERINVFAISSNIGEEKYIIKSENTAVTGISRLTNPSGLTIDRSQPRKTFIRWAPVENVLSYRVDIFNSNDMSVYSKTDLIKTEVEIDDTIPSGILKVVVRALAESGVYFNSKEVEIANILRLDTPVLEYVANTDGNFIRITNKQSYGTGNEVFVKIGEEDAVVFNKNDDLFQIEDNVDLSNVVVYAYVGQEDENNKNTICSKMASIEVERLEQMAESSLNFTDENNTTILHWDEVENNNGYVVNAYTFDGENYVLLDQKTVVNNSIIIYDTLPVGDLRFEIFAQGKLNTHFNSVSVSIDAIKLDNDVEFTIINDYLSWNKTEQEGALCYRTIIEEDITDVNLNVFKDELVGVEGEFVAYIRLVGKTAENYISSNTIHATFTKLQKVNNFRVENGEFEFANVAYNDELEAKYFIDVNGKEYLATEDGMLALYKDMLSDVEYTAKMVVRKDGLLCSDYSSEITVKKLQEAYTSEYWLYSNPDKTETYLHWESPDEIGRVKIILESPTNAGSFTNNTFVVEDKQTIEYDVSAFETDYNYYVYQTAINGEKTLINSTYSKTLKFEYVEGVNEYSIFYSNEDKDIISIKITFTEGIADIDNVVLVDNYIYYSVTEEVYNKFLAVSTYVDNYEDMQSISFTWVKKLTWAESESAKGYVIEQKYDYNGAIVIYADALYDSEESLYYVNYKLPVDLTDGNWSAYIQRFGGSLPEGNIFFINSNLSDKITFNKLKTPTLKVVDGVMTWEEVEGAVSYKILYNQEVVYSGTENRFELGSAWADEEEDLVWVFKLIAIGNVPEYNGHETQVEPVVIASDINEKEITKARVLGNLKIENGSLIWDTTLVNEEIPYTFNTERGATVEVQFIFGGNVITTIRLKDDFIYPNNAENTYLDIYNSVKKYLEENKEYQIRYREIGDNEALVNSEYKTAPFTFKLANSTKSISVTSTEIRWNAVVLSDYDTDIIYDIYSKKRVTGNYVYTYLTSVDTNAIDISLLRNWLDSSVSALMISTRGDNTNYLSGHFSSEIQIRIINDKTSLTTEKGTITWTSVIEAVGYEISVQNSDRVVIGNKEFISTNPREWTMEEIVDGVGIYPAGTYYLSIRALAGLGTTAYIPINSEYSTAVEFVKLQSPEVRIIDGTITWTEVPNATGYEISYLNSLSVMTTIDVDKDTRIFEPEEDFISGDINIRALGSTGKIAGKQYVSSNKAKINTTRTIANITDVELEDNQLTWKNDSADELTYIITVSGNNNEGKIVTYKDSTVLKTFDMLAFNLEGGEYVVNVRVKGVSGYVSSIPVGNINFETLDKVKNVSMMEGYLVWLKEENLVSEYSIHIYVAGDENFDYVYEVDSINNQVIRLNGEAYTGDSVFTTKDDFYKFWPSEVVAYSDSVNFIQAQYTVEVRAVKNSQIKYLLENDVKNVSLYDAETKEYSFFAKEEGEDNYIQITHEKIKVTFYNNQERIGETIAYDDVTEIPEGTTNIEYSFDMSVGEEEPLTLIRYDFYYTWSYGEHVLPYISSRNVSIAGVVLKYPNVNTAITYNYEDNKLTWNSGTGSVYFMLEVKEFIDIQEYKDNIEEYTLINYLVFDSNLKQYVQAIIDNATHVYAYRYVNNGTTNSYELLNKVKAIKIQCLPAEGDNLSNRFMSNFSNQYINEVPEAPTNLQYANGKLSWSASKTSNSTYVLTYKFENKPYTEFIGTVTSYNFKNIGFYSNISVKAIKSRTNKSADATLLEGDSGIIQNLSDNLNLFFNIYESGDGSVANPYVIKTATQLRAIDYYPNANFILGADIGTKENPFVISYTGSSSTGLINNMLCSSTLFRGSLNGNGFKITINMTVLVNIADVGEVGLFQRTQNATFVNVKIVVNSISVSQSSIANNFYVGLISGKQYNTTYTDCSFENKNGGKVSQVGDLGTFGTNIIYQATPAYGRALTTAM